MISDLFFNKLLSDNSVIAVYRLTSLLSTNISIGAIKERILEHPNHGSLLAIYDTLDELELQVKVFSKFKL